MDITHLCIPPLLAATTFWTYMHSKIRKVDRPTAEIIGVFVLVIIGISIIWFLLSAPWFLNLGIVVLLMFKYRYLGGGF